MADHTVAQLPTKVLVGHKGDTRLTFSPDSLRLGSTSSDGTSRVWDLLNGRPTHVFNHNEGQAIGFSPCGNLLATAAFGQFLVWDLRSRTEIFRNDDVPRSDGGEQIAFAQNIVVLATEGRILSWELPSGNDCRAVMYHPQDRVFDLRVAPDGSVFAYSYNSFCDYTDRPAITVRDAIKGTVLHLLDVGSLGNPVISNDGRLAAVAGRNEPEKRCEIFETDSGRRLHLLETHPGDETDVAFTLDGCTLVQTYDCASGPSEIVNRVTFWDINSGRRLARLPRTGLPPRINVSLHQNILVTVAPDRDAPADRTRFWDIPSAALFAEATGHSWLSQGRTFSPDGRWFVTVSKDVTEGDVDKEGDLVVTDLHHVLQERR